MFNAPYRYIGNRILDREKKIFVEYLKYKAEAEDI